MEADYDLVPTRQTLLSRLRDLDNQESWMEFFETYSSLIYHTAIKAGLEPVEAQDVVQETVIAVARSLPGFKYDRKLGSFKTWLLNMTHWRIKDQRRKRRPGERVAREVNDAARQAELEEIADPARPAMDLIWNEEWEKNVAQVAIERVKRKVDPKQFQVFELYVLQSWPATRIVDTFKLNSAQIYLIKHRVSRLIKKEIRALEKEHC